MQTLAARRILTESGPLRVDQRPERVDLGLPRRTLPENGPIGQRGKHPAAFAVVKCGQLGARQMRRCGEPMIDSRVDVLVPTPGNLRGTAARPFALTATVHLGADDREGRREQNEQHEK